MRSKNKKGGCMSPPKGSLTIVGLGIKFIGHMTTETKGWLDYADKILYAAGDTIYIKWIQENYPEAEPFVYYYKDRPRIDAYNKWVEQMLEPMREGKKVCAIFYGHPGVFVYASREAIRLSRERGYEAHMLPGISADACLYADLVVDPAEFGCQHYNATDFLLKKRKWDTRSSLILWQISLIGEDGYEKGKCNYHGIKVLSDYLTEYYGPDHEVIIYQAAQFSIVEPIINKLTIKKIPEEKITILSTLYIPPKEKAETDPEMLKLLKIK